MSVVESVGPGRPAGRPTAGIDWASEMHAVSVVSYQGAELERFTVEHTAAGLRRLPGRLQRAGVTEVGIERPDGPVVDALLAAGLTVLVIAPNRVGGLRSRSARPVSRTSFYAAKRRYGVTMQLLLRRSGLRA